MIKSIRIWYRVCAKSKLENILIDELPNQGNIDNEELNIFCEDFMRTKFGEDATFNVVEIIK